MRLSLNRALLGAVGAAILAGLVPAGIVLDRRLAAALEDRALDGPGPRPTLEKIVDAIGPLANAAPKPDAAPRARRTSRRS